jgi:predicted O-linked N-acetylglucosamine transferase (SPINDLY family)
VLVGLADSPSTHRSCSEMYIKEKFPLNSVLGAIPKSITKNKIRLGYYSADFRTHAVAILIAELIEIHNKEQFELIAFSLGPDVKDEMQNRISKAFDQFIDVHNESDQAVAKLSRQLGIDIAIDLGGLTADCRTGIFSFRAAPIQVNYLGYPGTLGADYIDYIIGDKTLIPSKSQEFYAEKVIYLPNSYQVNDRKRFISDKQFSRAELGLPKDVFVFCCFNNNYKILPETFDGWMRILTAIEGSVLWLFQDNDWVTNNLKKEAQKRGVSESRLVFAKRLPLDEHLARHRQADLFLDTFPCNAHTTASDALWAGLPVLTMMGESFASRVAASLLTAIGLPELITNSQKDYEALAIELASNPAKLKAIKAKIETNRLTTPLFDTPRFTKHLEDAYTKIYKRYHADLTPDHIDIQY